MPCLWQLARPARVPDATCRLLLLRLQGPLHSPNLLRALSMQPQLPGTGSPSRSKPPRPPQRGTSNVLCDHLIVQEYHFRPSVSSGAVHCLSV